VVGLAPAAKQQQSAVSVLKVIGFWETKVMRDVARCGIIGEFIAIKYRSDKTLRWLTARVGPGPRYLLTSADRAPVEAANRRPLPCQNTN